MEPDAAARYGTEVSAGPLSFGVLLRRWRERRRMTQADLAIAADSSTRHLSYLETGKSKPSREMVARLAEYLDIPRPDQDVLLLAAGFAPAFSGGSLSGSSAAKAAIEKVLEAHQPYPAFAVDRHWNVVLSNAALPQLYEGCAEELLEKPVNALRLILSPRGMGPRILNYSAWRAHSSMLLRQQIEARADPLSIALLEEVAGYPAPPGADRCDGFDESQRLATPLRIFTRLGVVSFLNTVTVFGTPNDVTLAELALEMLFPADEQTIRVVAAMLHETKAAR